MMNNGCREDNNNNNNSYCYFHPREAVIGVCPLCLNERLVILAATQRRRRLSRSAHKDTYVHNHSKKAPIQFHRIFDFGSLLHRFEFKSWKSDFDDRNDHDYYHDHDHDASTSQEDSFISIKFEENGNASWDKKKVCEEDNSWALKNNNNNFNNNNNNIGNYYNNKKSEREENNEESQIVIEHGRPRGSSLRWRKRIGHVFHLIRWKRSTNNGSACHVSNKVEGVKVRKRSWIRSLSKKTSFE